MPAISGEGSKQILDPMIDPFHLALGGILEQGVQILQMAC